MGVPGAAGFSLIFDSADAIIAYLPANGTPGVLTVDLDDPVSTASGGLGGEVVTATLNVLFSADGLLPHPPGVPFGDLVLQNLESLTGVGPEVAQLDGLSVQQALADANTLLGGAASPFTPLDMFIVLNDIDMSFNGGPVSTFAMEHLALPSTAPTVPEPPTWAMLLGGFGRSASWRFAGRQVRPRARQGLTGFLRGCDTRTRPGRLATSVHDCAPLNRHSRLAGAQTDQAAAPAGLLLSVRGSSIVTSSPQSNSIGEFLTHRRAQFVAWKLFCAITIHPRRIEPERRPSGDH